LPPPAMSQPVGRPPMQQPTWGPQPSRTPTQVKSSGLQPWMLVVGAIVMALVAFLVTRAFMRS
ncbi:MAG TPA: hypothetical protein VGM39_09785, partial [Kofleriaceae bacterium]